MIPKEDQGGYKPSQITAPTATGIGVPGSQYSKDVANQSSPSDLGQTRKQDLGDGTFVWQRMNSVTGQWENFGQPIPYQTNTAGEAVKPENYETVTTPNGTNVAFGNVSDPVVKYTAPIVLPTSDKLVTEQRDFIGAGGQNNVQIGLISTVKGYEYTPDIGRLSVLDKNRYIPAEVAIGGGITAQGYIDLQTRMFDYAFQKANIDWNRPGNPNYKPNLSTMKLYTDAGIVSGALSTGTGLMFGVNIPDPRKIDIGERKIEAQTVRAGLTVMPDAVKATEKTLKDIGNWYWNESGLSPLSPSYKPVEIGSNDWLLRVVPGASSELVGIRGVSLTADIIPRVPVLRDAAVRIGEMTAPAIKTASKTLEPITNSVVFKSPGEASSNFIANLDYNALSFKSPGEYLTRTSEVAYKYPEASINAPKSVVDEFFRPSTENIIPAKNEAVQASKLFDEGGYQYIGKGGVSDITVTSEMEVINPAAVRDLTLEESTMRITTLDEHNAVKIIESRGTVTPKINDELGFIDTPRREYMPVRINDYNIGEFKPSRMKNYDSVNVGQIKLGKTTYVSMDNANIFMYADEKTAAGKYAVNMKMNRYNPKSFSSGLNVEETYKSVVNAARADVEMRSIIGSPMARYSGKMATVGVSATLIRSEINSIKLSNSMQDQDIQNTYTFKPALGIMTASLTAGVLKSASETMTAVASKDITAVTRSTRNIMDTDTNVRMGIINIRNTNQGTRTAPIFKMPTMTMPVLPLLNGKLPSYAMDIPPYLTGSGYGYTGKGRSRGNAYRINLLNPFDMKTTRKHTGKRQRK